MPWEPSGRLSHESSSNNLSYSDCQTRWIHIKIMQDSSGIIHAIVGPRLGWLFRDSFYWTSFGLLGNVMFGSRFFLQWLHSEKHQRLVIPPIFWHLSFWGSIICLTYSLHIDKLPVILGYLFLPFIYARNLYFLRKSKLDVLPPQDA